MGNIDRSYRKYFAVENLKLDPNNPRIPVRLRREDATEDEIVQFMLDNSGLLDLMASIAENGFFDEESLLGIIDPNNPSKAIIIEGNRRLSAVKLLNRLCEPLSKKVTVEKLINNADPDNIPNELPVYIFSEIKEILTYLGYRHVTGIKSWGALEKANYLSTLYERLSNDLSEDDKMRSLAKSIGSKAGYVRKLLVSHRLYNILDANSYYGLSEQDRNRFKFSFLHDSVTKYLNISEFVGINFDADNPVSKLKEDNFKELISWLYRTNERGETRVGETRNIRYLNAIVSKERALESFRKGTPIQEAALLTALPEELLNKLLASSHRSLKNVYNSLPEINELEQGSLESIKEIKKLAELITAIIETKIN